jgi:hypothetical protein
MKHFYSMTTRTDRCVETRTCVTCRRLSGDTTSETQSDCSKCGSVMVRVLPDLVPDINSESRPASEARAAWSWIFWGIMWLLLSKKTIRQALKPSACWPAGREFTKSSAGQSLKGIHSETAARRLSSGVSQINCTIAWMWGFHGSILLLIWGVFMRVEAVLNNIVATMRLSNYELITLSGVTCSKQIQTQIRQTYYWRARLVIVGLVTRLP